jgi:Uri superfamily endonuclease
MAVTVSKLKTYILFIKVKRRFRTRIGGKGVKEFEAGYYLYVGSGRENLVQRIKRHLRMEKRKFWHIDYMLASKHVAIRDVYLTDLAEEEIVLRLEKSDLTIPHDAYFGASDSRKSTHLFYCSSYADICRMKGSMNSWS